MEENSGFEDLEDEAFPPLPPPHSPGQGRPEDGDPFGNEEENGDVSKLDDVPAAKRKGVKRPQPKLDSQRLTSDRGLPALRTLFENVRFKGKGREVDDLRLLMQKMENWAHRLYPKLQFDDFIDKVERLGNKKDVQTCLKRIRLDMPLTHDDFMGEEEPAPETNAFQDPDPFNGASFPDDLQGAIHSTPAPSAPPPPSPFTSPPALALTEEQRRRMELNRQRALERKLARQQQQTDSQSVDSSASADDPTCVSSADVVSSSSAQVNEEETKRLDLETVDDTEQQPSESSHRDSEPSEEPAQTHREEEEKKKEEEEEEESSPSAEDQPENESEDGEKLMN